MTIVTETELRELIQLDQESLQAVADGFSALATTEVALPPIMRIDVPDQNGEVDVKSAYVHGAEQFAIKIAGGFWENPKRHNLPSSSGQMIVLSATTGRCEAILLDNGYLTDVRTALAGALAARHLARTDLTTVGQIGAGAQGQYQMRALQLVRPYERVLIWDRDRERLDDYVRDMPEVLGVEVVKAGSVEEVVRNSDCVTTSTPSQEPFVKASWLHEGLHMTAMGADAEHKQELFPECLGRADLIVCDRTSQCVRLGELHHALASGTVADESSVHELGELTAGQHPGRTDDAQITVADLTGVGVQDTAISLLACAKARAAGAGVEIGP
ncbi:MAG: cyclodeaminase [Gemmatimonadetes bacterium]|nr:cyclodeaminase [Gemmatimonadota bacterium]MBT7863637.1 cyclodeaminase [Gemmatimonadota bacterium]